MERTGALFLLSAIFFFVAQMQRGLCASDTVPAFLWSPHYPGSSQHVIKKFVNYHTMSPEELTNSVLSQGGWSELLCSGEMVQHNVDIALIFVGRKLKSSDISRQSDVEPALVQFLKQSFTTSNFSMAFPYVAKSDEVTLENSIISGFIQNCGLAFGASRIASSDACNIDGEGITKLSDIHSVHRFLSSKAETGREGGQTNLIVLCDKDSQESDGIISEDETFPGLLTYLGNMGTKYTVLYTSDPSTSLGYHEKLDRFLVEGSHGNKSLSSTGCDEVCQIKSSLLEGIFVAIVLLIILLSGLCCMMGIDTPRRFQTPQES